ncbi:MAG: hypothetical protein AAGF87_02675 [Bacteroidota bacterium]
MKNTYGNVKHFARDLIILVLGIVLSLMLNDWRENRSARTDEMRVVNQMVEDLASDTSMIGEALLMLQELKTMSRFASSADALDSDSLLDAGMTIWSLSTYLPIVPQKTAFYELTYQDQHRNIRAPGVASSFINLHEDTYNLLDMIIEVHGRYILEDYVPFLNESMPTEKNILRSDRAALDRVKAQLESSEMQNRLAFLATIISNVEGVMTSSASEASALLTTIKEKYNL